VILDLSYHPSLILLASHLPPHSLSSLAAPTRYLPSSFLSLQVLEDSLHFHQRIQALRLENSAEERRGEERRGLVA